MEAFYWKLPIDAIGFNQERLIIAERWGRWDQQESLCLSQ